MRHVRYLRPAVFPLQCYAENPMRSIHHISQDSSPSLWRGCIVCVDTSATSSSVSRLPCHVTKESEAVPVGNGPVSQQEEFGPDQPRLEEVYRMIKDVFEERDRRIYKMQEYTEERTSMNQRLTRLEHDARQPRLAMEADGPANTKTRERTEGTAKAVQAKHEDSCTAQKVQDGPKILPVSAYGRISRSPLQGWHRGRERRCGAQVVSPILGDALTNSRWGLTSLR